MPSDFRSEIRGPLRRFFICTFIACIGNGLTLSLFVVHRSNWWPIGTGRSATVGGAMLMNLRRHISASADGRPKPAI